MSPACPAHNPALFLAPYDRQLFIGHEPGGDGLSFKLASIGAFEFGPALTFARGRDESDADRLRGLGNIKGGAEVGAFARWHISSATLHANLKRSAHLRPASHCTSQIGL